MSLIRQLLLHTPTRQRRIVATTNPMEPFIESLHSEQNSMELGHSEILEYSKLVITCITSFLTVTGPTCKHHKSNYTFLNINKEIMPHHNMLSSSSTPWLLCLCHLNWSKWECRTKRMLPTKPEDQQCTLNWPLSMLQYSNIMNHQKMSLQRLLKKLSFLRDHNNPTSFHCKNRDTSITSIEDPHLLFLSKHSFSCHVVVLRCWEMQFWNCEAFITSDKFW